MEVTDTSVHLVSTNTELVVKATDAQLHSNHTHTADGKHTGLAQLDIKGMKSSC